MQVEPQGGQGPEARNNPLVNREERKDAQGRKRKGLAGEQNERPSSSHNHRPENPMSKHSYEGGDLLFTSRKGISFLFPLWETYRHLHIRKAKLSKQYQCENPTRFSRCSLGKLWAYFQSRNHLSPCISTFFEPTCKNPPLAIKQV